MPASRLQKIDALKSSNLVFPLLIIRHNMTSLIHWGTSTRGVLSCRRDSICAIGPKDVQIRKKLVVITSAKKFGNSIDL